LLQALSSCRPLHATRSQALAMLDRGVLKLSKTLTQLVDTHPW
jgi:hypothetical protein